MNTDTDYPIRVRFRIDIGSTSLLSLYLVFHTVVVFLLPHANESISPAIGKFQPKKIQNPIIQGRSSFHDLLTAFQVRSSNGQSII